MSSHSVHVTAHLSARSFTPGQRIGWQLVVTAIGRAIVPDPLSGDSLTLKLRGPTGKTEVVRLGDIAPPAGVLETDDVRDIPPGGKVVFEEDLATHFPHISPGPHWLQIEYKVDEGVWRSPELPFELLAGHATFLDVTPNEATGLGRNAVVWVERGPKGARAMLFDDDGRATSLQGAQELVAIAEGALLALGSKPANLPDYERWVAWISGDSLHLQFYADADAENPGNTLHPPSFKLPAGLREPRIVRPLLEESVGDGRPHGTVPVLAKNADGTESLHLLEIDPKGRVTPREVIAIPGVTAGCWAITPSRGARVFAYALAVAGQVVVFGVEVPWQTHGHGHGHGHAPTPVQWRAFDADAFVLGDLRCTEKADVWMGLVVRRGHEWERLVLLAPTGGRKDAEIVYRSSFSPPAGAEPIRARVDGHGELHLLYRRGKELAYVPPKQRKPTFTSDRLGALAPQTAHLILAELRRVLVAYDPESGPFWKVL